MRNYFIVTIIIFTLTIIVSCSDDVEEPIIIIKEEPKMEVNKTPTVNGQSFEIEENTISGTLIGSIQAEDPENDPLKFSMPIIEGLQLDTNTGELTITKGAEFLDYETNEEYEFEVTVSDGTSSVKSKIVLIIIDIEDGFLTNFEKSLVEGFKVEVLNNSTDFPLNKWTETAKIFYSGAVTPSLRSITSNSIKSFNELFTDGFKIEIVNDSLSANVQLFSGTIEEVKELWPDFGSVIDENPGLGGVALIGGGRIWIADYAQNLTTAKHEIGHMIGLNHAPANQCNGEFEENSLMCGGSNAAGKDFTALDTRLIQYYYHPEIMNNEEANVILEKLNDLILTDREEN